MSASASPIVTILTRVVAGAVTALGTIVMLGYLSNIGTVIHLTPGLPGMSPVTATGLIVLSGNVLAETWKRVRLARGFAWAGLLIGAACIALFPLTGHGAGPWIASSLLGFTDGTPGQTSIATASCFIALSLSALTRHWLRLADVLAGIVLMVSGAALLGYSYGARDLYAIHIFATMAPHTGAALFILAATSVVARPQARWAAVLLARSEAGAATRRQLGFVLFTPLVGGLLLRATKAHQLGPAAAMAFLVILTVAPLAILILRDGRISNALDAERKAKIDLQRDLQRELETQLALQAQELRAQAEEREKAEDQLRQSQKMEAVGQLTGGVAHDFNNMLTVIRSSVDLLRRPNLSEDRRQRFIEAISDTVTRAAKLTAQLLAFSRRQSLMPEVFDVGRNIIAIQDMVATLVGSSIEIVINIPDDACYVQADPTQLDTAIVNMAANARDAMNGQGQLTIAVQSVSSIPPVRSHPAIEGNFVAICITDTGSGIPADAIENVFEPFFTTKEVGQGTGLGLSQVFGFAKQSGGEIRVESKPGEGTTFVMYLAQVSGTQMKATNDAPLSPPVDGHGTRVLVVEDNNEVGSLSTQALTELGYRSVWVDSAERALAALAEDCSRFDIVFSDVVMPGMNGIDLAQEIRRDHPDMPVILTSGYSHVLAQDGSHGFELLRKPYSVEELSLILNKAVQSRQRSSVTAYVA